MMRMLAVIRGRFLECAWVIAMPMKIGGGSGGPMRIVALVPR